MRSIRIIAVVLAVAVLAAACSYRVRVKVKAADCSGTTSALYHRLALGHETPGAEYIIGKVGLRCEAEPRQFDLNVTLQYRYRERVSGPAWHYADSGVEFFNTLHPAVPGREYVIPLQYLCPHGLTARWRIKETYSGISSTGVVFPPVTVYAPRERGKVIHCLPLEHGG